jgi:glycosyltransferase involved in cell wall biosynthesis
LVGLFRSSDIVCVPSRNEPFGIVILEAWSAKKPVVVTRRGGPAEFVRHGETGLVVSDNQDSIGWGVGTALAHGQDAKQMGQNGRHVAEQRFSWDEIAGRTEEVYASVA